MATKKTTPEPELEVQPDAEPLDGLDALPRPDAELEVQPDAEPEKPRDALEYIREQRGEG
jgi:hypothetical protein